MGAVRVRRLGVVVIGAAALGACDMLFGPSVELGTYALTTVGDVAGPPFLLYDTVDADGHRNALYITGDTIKFETPGRMLRAQYTGHIVFVGGALDTLYGSRALTGSFRVRDGEVRIEYDDFGGLPLFTDDTLHFEEGGRLRNEVWYLTGCPPYPCQRYTVPYRYELR